MSSFRDIPRCAPVASIARIARRCGPPSPSSRSPRQACTGPRSWTRSVAPTSLIRRPPTWTLRTQYDTYVAATPVHGGLNLGTPYHVAADRHGDQYPTGLNSTDSGTGLPWAPATDGLRNLAGRVNPTGTVSLWAATSTLSGSATRAPNKPVEITDSRGATTASQVAHERFHTVMQATYGHVIRGVTFMPGTPLTNGYSTGP